MTSQTIICLLGPTCSGKTALSLALSKQLPIEIISVDSALVYRGMDIGTAKPTLAERAEVPHHLIDIRDPSEPYSAADFCVDAERLIQEIFTREKIPLLVGGTMLYFKALLQGMSAAPSSDPLLRAQLQQQLIAKGSVALHERLKTIDPQAAARIHPNDPQRILRALEVYQVTGKTLTEYWQEQAESSPYHAVNIGLMPDRNLLPDKIARRFQAMLDQGFLAEVSKLYARGDLTKDLPALRAVGYRQAWQYLAGEIDLATMQETALAATRQLAKRQLTWLRQWPNLHCIAADAPDCLQQCLQVIANNSLKS